MVNTTMPCLQETHAASTPSSLASKLVRADSDEMMDESKAAKDQKTAIDKLQVCGLLLARQRDCLIGCLRIINGCAASQQERAAVVCWLKQEPV